MPQSRIRARSAASAGGGSGGATTFNQYASFYQFAGPASYATGGFVVDLSSTYSDVESFSLKPKKGTRGNVPFGRLRVRLNTPTAGKVTVLVMRHQQETTTAFVTASGQPAGVTLQGASGATTSSEAAHTHTTTHGHVNTTSSTQSTAGSGYANLGTVGATHTHTATLPSEAFTSGAGASHSHVDNTVYEHGHALTHVVTNLTEAELANATVLSATTFLAAATGVRA